jgi:hypothetical protein
MIPVYVNLKSWIKRPVIAPVAVTHATAQVPTRPVEVFTAALAFIFFRRFEVPRPAF